MKSKMAISKRIARDFKPIQYYLVQLQESENMLNLLISSRPLSPPKKPYSKIFSIGGRQQNTQSDLFSKILMKDTSNNNVITIRCRLCERQWKLLTSFDKTLFTDDHYHK